MATQLAGYVMGRLLDPLPPAMLAGFTDLEADVIGYTRSGSRTRKRAFSAFAFEQGEFVHAPALVSSFNSRRPFHSEFGANGPVAIDERLIAGGVPQALLTAVAPSLPIAIERYAIGFNMIRVTADDDQMGSPAPGLHQDGYEFSCHIAIARSNAAGGTSILATAQHPDAIVLEHTLQQGEFVFFNDARLYHTATPVTCRIGGFLAHRDMVILDFVSLG
jgi:hypothetical protein